MQHKSVTSSNIESIGYDPSTQTLEVKFKSGGTYSYPGVSQQEYDDFEGASSLGSHFHSKIRNKFSGSKL
jgi:KTSC domain